MPPPLRAPRSAEPLRRGAAVALVASVILPVAALGGAAPVAGPLALAAALTSLVLLVAAERGRLAVPPLATVPLAVATCCALQLLPLPPALGAALSPPLRELRDFALAPLGLDRWRPLSLDPPATAAALAGSLAAACAVVSGAGLARSRRSRRFLAGGVGLASAAVAVVGFGHALADAHVLFGLHRFQNGELAFVTPFGNPNHLAAFATGGTALLLGLLLDADERPRRALWGLAAIASGASAFLSLSRGGIAFWVAGQLALVLLVLGRRAAEPRPAEDRGPVRRTTGSLARAVPALLAVGAVVAVAGYLASERLGAELATVDTVEKLRTSKVELWPMFARVPRAAWLTGIGRGTFALAFPRWQTAHAALTFTFTHPENLPLQLAAELGLPVTLALAALAAWAAVRTLRRSRRPLPPLVLAAWAGVGALLLHDLFDFALELPACAMAAAVATGLASASWAERAPTLRRARSLPLAGAVLAVALLAALVGRDSAPRTERALTELAAAARPEPGESARPDALARLRTAAREAVDRHPADASLYRIVGWAEASIPGGQPRLALAWLNRALFLRPLDPDSHRLAARALFLLGAPGQALVEERLALESGADAATVLAESLPRARDPDALWSLVGPSPANVDPLVLALWQAGRRDDARAVLDRALVEFDGRPEAGPLAVLDARLRLQTGDPEGALALLERAEAAGQDVALWRAAATFALGRHRDAIQELESAVSRRPSDAELAFTLAGYWLAERKPALARAALDRLQPFLAGSGARTRLLLAQADTYRSEGRSGRALELVQSAVRLSPNDPGLHRQAAQLFEALGRPREALDAVRTSVRLAQAPADAATVAWMDRLGAALDAELARALAAPPPGAVPDEGAPDAGSVTRRTARAR